MDNQKQRRWLVPAGALLLSMSLLATAAFAGTDKPANASTDQDTSIACVVEDWQPTPDEITEMNAETDALVAYLADAGFTVTVETNEFGISYPLFDDADESNDALWEAMDAFYAERYGDLGDSGFGDAGFEDWQPSADEVAEMNAETDALVTFMADAGFTLTLEADEFGISYPVFSDADESNDALWEAMDAFYVERYGDLDEWQPTTDEIAEINAETDALVAYLADAGFTVEVETDDMGLTNVVFSAADSENEALWQAVDSFYGDYYDDPSEWQPTADELAEMNTETDALVAYLADAGFTVEIGTDEIGFTYPAFTEADNDNDALWRTVEAFYADRYGDPELDGTDPYHGDWQPSAEQLAQNNSETEGLIAALADSGFTVATATDELGFVYADFTEADYNNDALMRIVDEYYMVLYGEEPCSDGVFDMPDVNGIENDISNADASANGSLVG
ncbi:hypothetical protein MNBD_ACTINO02-1463 [hydrothermal vent metagenome]|uniref:Uncharacterized protein n=1 Tax=hydrothermal vent metagenome TaxID=652676 RepID=A0A3B0TBQ2_9ZZZZ